MVEALEALQEWGACVGVVLVVEVEAALEGEARLLHLIHTDHVRPRDLGHQLRPAGEENTVRGHLHTRGADPGRPRRPRVEEAEDDTRRTMTAVAARVATAMGVATVVVEVAQEIAGVTAEQPWLDRVAATCTSFEIGAGQGSLMSQRTAASYRRRAEVFGEGG